MCDSTVRAEVSRSWRRSLGSVDPARDSAPGSDTDIGARWLDSPLYRPVTELAEQLRDIAEGRQPSNKVAVRTLSRFQREQLQEALGAVEHVDDFVRDLLF